MYCPTCGSQAAEKQKFCRACGMSLEGFAERVALHQGTTSITESRRDRWLTSIGIWMAISGGGMFLLMLLFASINQAFDLLDKSTINFIVERVPAIALISLFFGTGFFALPHLLRWRRPSRPLSPPTGITAELVRTPVPTNVSSVTEATTRNLEPALSEKAKQHE